MAQDPQNDNIGSVLRWETFLAKEKSIGRFQKLLNTAGDSQQAVMRTFLAYMDELMHKGESPDLDEMFTAYLQVRWGKVTNIHKIMTEIKSIVGEVSKKYTMFQKMNLVIRQQLLSGRIPFIKVDAEHKDEFSRRLADRYFPSTTDQSIIGTIPIQPPPRLS